ncbi:MAG: hypothetical protein K2M30_00595 [Desulfovibrionaceae bacterium]|nr:hypothetical protein [Desulfovibrionaceae bacterium]
MLFSSLVFLSLFLPIVIGVYYLLIPSLRNYFLLISSLVFYAWGEPRYLALMLFVIILSYFSGIALTYLKIRKTIILLSILSLLSLLFYFKYTSFVLSNIHKVYTLIEPFDIAMPLGISFFIFQAISYTIDVYRKNVATERDISVLGLYIAFFPQLIAGPIIKYHDIYKQISCREGGG